MEVKPNKGINLIGIGASIIAVILLAVGIFVYKKITDVAPVFTEITYELGDVEISEDISNYIITSDFMKKRAVLDVEDVDTDTVGDYIITCTVRKKIFNYDVHIVDTTKPELKFGEISKTFGTYNTYTLDDLNVSATDISELNDINITSYLKDGEKVKVKNNEFTIDEAGTYKIYVEVSDVFDNVETDYTKIEIVDAPHFILLSDREYKIGTPFSLSDFVYAEDRNGNDLTGEIVITDSDGYDVNVEGSYEVTYSVTDSDDINREETITIDVGEFEHNDYGFKVNEETMDTLIAHHHFDYEPLVENEDDDFDKVIELTSHTSFGVKNYDSVSSGTYYFFSAFIYKITSDNIYFITNRHCHTPYSYTVFYDYNDYKYEVKTSEITFVENTVEGMEGWNGDLRLMIVPIENFSVDDYLAYKEAYIEWDIYDSTEIGDSVLVNTQSWGHVGSKNQDITKTSTISCLLEPDDKTLAGYHVPMFVCNSNISKNGQSGSPMFDKYGNLVAVLNSSYIGRTGGILLTDLKTFIDSAMTE